MTWMAPRGAHIIRARSSRVTMRIEGIEFRHLRFFIALAEERSFSRAAARCNVSQPPFSVAIQQLESNLGVSLVERSSRQVHITPAGLAFYERAQRVIAQANDAYAQAVRVAEGKKGLLRIGFHASMIFRGFPLMLDLLQKEEPHIGIELMELASQDQAEAIIAGRLDVGFAHSILAPEPLSAITVYSEPFVACLPETHAAARHESFSLDMLRGEDFILFSRGASPAYFDRIVSLCVEAGFTPHVRHQVRQWLTVVSMVSHGMGVAIVPKCLSDTGIRGCVFRPLDDTLAASTIQCMWLSTDESPLVARLVGFAQRFLTPSPQHVVA